MKGVHILKGKAIKTRFSGVLPSVSINRLLKNQSGSCSLQLSYGNMENRTMGQSCQYSLGLEARSMLEEWVDLYREPHLGGSWALERTWVGPFLWQAWRLAVPVAAVAGSWSGVSLPLSQARSDESARLPEQMTCCQKPTEQQSK